MANKRKITTWLTLGDNKIAGKITTMYSLRLLEKSAFVNLDPKSN